MNWKKCFITVAWLCLASQIAGAVISIALALPAQVTFGSGGLAPADATSAMVTKELLSKGTALAPPLALTIIFMLLLLLARRRGVLGATGTLLLMLLGVLFTAATLGEYANPDRFPNMSSGAYIALLLVNQVFIAGVTIFGAVSLFIQVIEKIKNRGRGIETKSKKESAP